MHENVTVEVEINREFLAWQIQKYGTQEEAIELVLLIDQYVGDVQFTELLIQKLQGSLESEDE
ncbi:hypothetical protein [Streptomyces althioticus]|uniref:hypothetical protein n=1 Tax=Streptomyces althioticus TaxID=83380 RepID=UPI0033C7FFFA